MKNRKWITAILLIVLAAIAFGIGFSGFFELAKPAETENTQDLLVGVFITKEYLDLFDVDSYFEDHISEILKDGNIPEEDANAYRQRLYASETVDSNHDTPTFAGIEGISVFCAYAQDENGGYWISSGDDACSDGKMALTETEELERIEMSKTIYVSTKTDWKTFYVNPMYQTSDGRVYILSGNGMFYDSPVSGMSFSQTMNESKETAVNGEKKTFEADIRITFQFMDSPTSATILQFDKDSRIIAQDTYASNALPMTVKPLDETEYIIVETTSAAGTTRELFTPQDGFAYAFLQREDGICIKQYIEINWNPNLLA